MAPGACDEREAAHILPPYSDRIARGWGLYSVVLFRYSHSPVGAYDELIYIPGFVDARTLAKDKQINMAKVRITRIYVSTDESIRNGRENWNIPKHKAIFDFSEPEDAKGSIDIRISLPGGADPFFSVRVIPSQRLPSFPFKWAWVPLDYTLLQPPLPHLSTVEVGTADAVSHNNDDDDSSPPKTTEFKATPFGLTMPKARLAYIYPRLPVSSGSTDTKLCFSDGIHYPDIAPITAGIYCAAASVDFLEPETVQVLHADVPKVKQARRTC